MSASHDTATAAIRWMAHHPVNTAAELSAAFPTLDAQQVDELFDLFGVPERAEVTVAAPPELTGAMIEHQMHTLNQIYALAQTK